MNADERAKAYRVCLSIRQPVPDAAHGSNPSVPDSVEIGGSVYFFETRDKAKKFADWISKNSEWIKVKVEQA